MPLTAAQMAEGFASHDALAPTVSDQITAILLPLVRPGQAADC